MRRVLACLAAVMAGLSAFAADLRISEIMPKPTDALERGSLAGMDPNGLESGWVELENISDHDVDLADYRFICVKRGKKTDTAGYGNFPSWKIPAGGRTVFYTSERYANSADMSVSAFATPVSAEQPMIYQGAPSNQKMLIWPDKVNPKKFPFVRLYHAPGGVVGEVVDTVVIPSDLPEGASIIVGPTVANKATQRWICLAPTKNAANPSTSGLTALGPNVGPLYEAEDKKKTGVTSEFDLPVPPAIPGTDYAVTFAANPVMNPNGSFAPRTEDTITKIQIVYRKDLNDSTKVTKDVDLSTPDVGGKWGSRYTVTIPNSFFPAAGHLIQWKFKLTDKAGNVWTSPSHHNLDDGYEWYGTIVQPSADQLAKSIATWHLFADAETADGKPGQYNPDCHMNKDASGINTKTDLPNGYPQPYGARVSIYDSSTSNYYDYVRIDLRGNTSQGNGFIKNSHGLRFAKVHPMTMWDCVTGKTVEGRKTSLVGEYADVSYLRQMTSFWLYNKNGSPCPFHIPVRVNLNGSFYKFAFNSERMTDELIEDIYGFDKFGYTFKSIGSWGNGALAGGTEKKTPDDENESDTSVLKAFTDTLPKALVTSDADHLKYSKIVAEKFDLPAWLNYIALSRITHETGDTGANSCGYYDNPDLLEGVRGTGTWRPLGYDQQQTFGVWSVKSISPVPTVALMSNTDFLKSHPLYDGYATRPWNSEACTTPLPNDFICRAYEAIYQSEKFRRLFVRRLRTLMDAELGAPDTTGTETWQNTTIPFMVKMREMAAKIKDEAAKDRNLWKYPNHGIFVWQQVNNLKRSAGLTPDIVVPANVDAALEEIWKDYVVPRRVHLYQTHSVDNKNKTIDYGTQLNAGIPHAQSAIANLKAGITAQWDATHGAIRIQNSNTETIDLSDWVLSGPVTMTLPPGTVIDQKVGNVNGEVYVTADRRATVAKFGSSLTDQVIVGNGSAGAASATITLTAADGTKVIASASDVAKSLRLDSFDGITPTADGDTDEWFTLKNTGSKALDLSGVKVVFVKDGEAIENAKCVVTLPNMTLAVGATITLKQADYGWNKITNGKIWFYLTDAGGAEVQSLYINQKDAAFANYYGAGGPGGAYYLKAQSYDAADVSFKEVASAVTESNITKFLRLHSFDGVTPTETADTEEWITVTNIGNVSLDLKGVKLVFLKAKDRLEDAKCVVTNSSSLVLAPGKSHKFEQAACGWEKISNGDVVFSVIDADGATGQSLAISQPSYADYYGEYDTTGSGGDCYLQATTFQKSSETFEEVPYSGHRHSYGAWTRTKEPTCTEKGVETRTCTAAGCTIPPASQTREVAALGHAYGEWQTTKEPQIGVAGEQRRDCTREGCDDFEAQTIAPLNPDDPPLSGDVTTNPMPGHADWGTVATYSIGNTKYTAYVYTKVGEAMTFEVPANVTSIDYLVVAGGGSGGARSGSEVGGAGGGGGGVLSATVSSLVAGQTFTVNVGAGADGVTGSQAGKKGGNSSLVCAAASVNAVAEGGGAGGQYGAVGGDGGCGGGGGGQNSPSQGPAGGKGSQGNAGGYGFCFGMGGGGGAGGAGGDATAAQNGGNGGAGFASAIAGTTRYYAAGGAGAGALKTAYTAGTDGAAATDGAGVGENGADGLGAGGGGQAANSAAASGKGGSGTVIIRYVTTGGGEDPEPVVHTHDYKWTVTEPTCLAAGVSNGVCKATSGTCNARNVSIAFGEKVDHVYEGGECKWCHQAEPVDPPEPPPSGDVTEGPIPGHEDWGYVCAYKQGNKEYRAFVYTNVTAEMSFPVPADVTSIDYLVVGGGGGGGGAFGGGGGAGGFLEDTLSSGLASTYAIQVGAGGTGGVDNVSVGANGGNSSLGTIVALGGGGGATYNVNVKASAGGSGGGGSAGKGTSAPAAGAGTEGQGFAGGDGVASSAAGGGGGAGGPGVAGVTTPAKKSGDGGVGKTSDITGETREYAGGGGGCGDTAANKLAAGSGAFGGGNGGVENGSGGDATTPGSGGGGAARIYSYSNSHGHGGRGADGIVVVRYEVSGGDEPQPESDGYMFTFKGAYAGDQAIAPTGAECVVVLDGATVAGKLVLPDGVKAYLSATNGTENALGGIVGPAAHLTVRDFDGLNGKVAIEGKDTLIAISNLVVKSGTLELVSTGSDTTNKVRVVNVLGHVKQDGGTIRLDAGRVDPAVQVQGVYVANKDPKGADGKKLKVVYAEFNGGTFEATVGGGKSSALFINKGSAEATFNDGHTNVVSLAGPEARFVNAAGDLNLKGGEFSVTMPGECASLTNARVFKSDKAIKVKGGHYSVNAPGAGSEVFSVSYNGEDPSEITIDGGTFELVAADDCFSADYHITVNGGLFHAVSLNDDVFDSNGDITLNGGTILAYATAEGHEAFDVDPILTTNDTGVAHKLYVNGGVVFATGGKGAVWPENTVLGAGVGTYARAGLVSDDHSGKYLTLTGAADMRYAAKLPQFPQAKCAVFATCQGLTGTPTLSSSAPVEGDQHFHDYYLWANSATNQGELRFHTIYGSTTDGGDTGEYIVLTNVSAKTVKLAGVTVSSAKFKGGVLDNPKCKITLAGGEVGPNGSVRLDQADFAGKGWEKITNGGIFIKIESADGAVVQSGYASFDLYPETDGQGAALVAKRFDDNAQPLAATTDDWGWVMSTKPQPTVDGQPVEPEKVFGFANSRKPITYPSAPELKGEVGSQQIVFGGKTVDVPEYYTATPVGNTVTLALNDNAKPKIADGTDGTKAFVVTDTTVSLHLEHTYENLYYALATGEKLDGTWTTGKFEKGKAGFTVNRDKSASACFCKIVVSDHE